ncbi:hypothetical protein HZC30_07330 [Candidatus Woesearchaeota archaeon]|nr:hypothetical protein [Candidatus Woesearchaeota archaeon]
MKKIGLVSFGTRGTSGHMTLLTELADSISQKGVEIYVISEYDYQAQTNIRSPNIYWRMISSQKHQESVAGKLKHKSAQEVNKIIEQENIDSIIFSTFFDPEIIQYAKENKMHTSLITYPLRDSYSNLFFMKGFQKLFSHVFVLEDIIPMNIYEENGAIISRQPAKKYQREEKKDSVPKILISCGGAGLPSAEIFYALVNEAILGIFDSYPDSQITITTGALNDKKLFGRLKKDNRVRIIEWIKEWSKEAAKSDLVINEAGYFSVNELVRNSVPTILIPGSRRMDNQELRAINYQRKGFGYCVLPQEGVSSLIQRVDDFFRNSEQKEIIKSSCEEYNKRRDLIPSISENITKHLIN